MSASFDAAVRRLLGAPSTATVTSEMEGGEEVGCHTCGDTEPRKVVLRAYNYESKPADYWTQTFDSLPALWDALEKAEGGYQTSHVENQFWRESKQKWIPHVHIVTWGKDKDAPTKWRHRTVTETTMTAPWIDGKHR